VRLYHCPFQELEQVAGLVPNSVDFFYADIPFDGSFLPQLADLAALAARVLRDGGICAVQSGQYVLNQVMAALSERLTYRWMMATVWDGPAKHNSQTELGRPSGDPSCCSVEATGRCQDFGPTSAITPLRKKNGILGSSRWEKSKPWSATSRMLAISWSMRVVVASLRR